MRPFRATTRHARQLNLLLEREELDAEAFGEIVAELNDLMNAAIIEVKNNISNCPEYSCLLWRFLIKGGETTLALDCFRMCYTESLGEDEEMDRRDIESLLKNVRHINLEPSDVEQIKSLKSLFEDTYQKKLSIPSI
ncbi:hypothetical protein [Ruegeria sp.]|uniref:hypothetical protein n=1 Tax=Ruegeria sp. TaxID=1879320 RepID=UPI0023110CB6|nr:hypothetical protein [Ruegeria sp.]MDA7966141.1 hypothetical protein [Ruegeria sp.]